MARSTEQMRRDALIVEIIKYKDDLIKRYEEFQSVIRKDSESLTEPEKVIRQGLAPAQELKELLDYLDTDALLELDSPVLARMRDDLRKQVNEHETCSKVPKDDTNRVHVVESLERAEKTTLAHMAEEPIRAAIAKSKDTAIMTQRQIDGEQIDSSDRDKFWPHY